jgi:hypothetical protein
MSVDANARAPHPAAIAFGEREALGRRGKLAIERPLDRMLGAGEKGVAGRKPDFINLAS